MDKQIPEIFITQEEADLIERYLTVTNEIREAGEKREEIRVLLTKKFKGRAPFRYKDYNIQMTPYGLVPHKRKSKK